jgi:hypothetical protein
MHNEVGMARTTISLPDELKARMEGVEENWSAIAAQAFERRLRQLKLREETDMTSVINRLRASKMEYDETNEAAGMVDGRRWATKSASYGQLKRLARVEAQYENDDEAWLMPKYAIDEDYDPKDFWESFAEDAQISAGYVNGFMEGAQEVFLEVEDQL